MTDPDGLDPMTAWLQMIAILTTAADTPTSTGVGDPELHSLALGAQIVASRALALVPAAADGDLEDVVRDVDGSFTVGDLILAAGHVVHRFSVVALPAGSAAVLTELDELIAQAEAIS